MKFDILDILNILTIAWLTFFSFFLVTYKKGKKNNNYFLAWLLLTNAVFNLASLIQHFFETFPYYVFIFLVLGGSTGYFFGPAIFFYTKSLTNKIDKVNKTFFVHLIPFLLSIIYYLFFDYRNWRIIQFSIMYLHILIYLLFSFKLLKNFQIKIKDFFSSLEKLHIKRLGLVLLVFSLLWFIDIILFINHYSIFLSNSEREIITYFLFSINLIFAVFIVFDSLTHPELLNIKLKINSDKKYKNSKLTENEKENYIKELDDLILSNKPYLDYSLTLNDLAKMVKIPARELSQIINESKKKNFYDYINSYRIKEAKHILSSSNEETILEVLYKVGFNSKSAFNTAFKKNTGLTPSKFRLNSKII